MKKIIFFVGLTLLMVGCTYPLEITNQLPTPSPIKPAKPVKIGFLPSEDPLLNAVMEELSFNSAVAEAKKGYQLGSAIPVDYVSALSQTTKFDASGQNFWITIPGFLVFTHAWLGYKYYIDIDTQSKILDPGGKVLNEATFITPYEIRYTSFPRGAATSLIGWLLPPYGLLDIIPGFLFSSDYDYRATPEFIEKAKPSYKTFVSSKILEQIAGVQGGTASEKATFKMKPVVIGGESNEKTVNNAGDRHFAIHVMKIENGRLIPFSDTVKELSPETHQLLGKIAKKEIQPNAEDINSILISFGISDIQLPKDMSLISMHTVQNNEIVKLFNGKDFDARMALVNK